MKMDFLENIENTKPEEFKELTNDHYTFTFSNGLSAILLFLTSKS